jgi:hypothetical protein
MSVALRGGPRKISELVQHSHKTEKKSTVAVSFSWNISTARTKSKPGFWVRRLFRSRALQKAVAFLAGEWYSGFSVKKIL